MNSFFASLTGSVYQQVVKPIFFQLDAESVHGFMVNSGEFAGEVAPIKSLFERLYSFEDDRLSQKVAGIHFNNPIGLAAGFDYNAKLTQILSSVGFGFQAVGTITAEPYEGNARPRLGRLPKSRSLLVNKGYKNYGIEKIIEKLKEKKFSIPVGMSIGSTNREYENDAEQIENFITSFQKTSVRLKNISYYELNISCPNLKTGEPFNTPPKLRNLLKEVEKLKLKKPIFIKMPTDISVQESNRLLKVATEFAITGAIIGNLTKDRKNPDLDPSEIAKVGKGNFSGKPTEKRTNNLLQAAYKEYKKDLIFIGCGGIFSADDAYRKIKLGATLVQMITGMIYQGPQIIGQINQGLVKLLNEEGYTHISEAIGKGV